MKRQFRSTGTMFKLMLLTTLLITAAEMPVHAQQKANAAKVTAPKQDLHTAVMKNDVAAVKQHIAAKSDLNMKESMGGSTPLIMAALLGRPAIAKLLIDAGANLNLKNNDGSTALHVASFFCRPDIVKMLLAKRADKTIRNNFKSTAYEGMIAPFAEVKGVYEMMGKMLAPIGLKLDMAYIEKTRPVIAAMLK